MYKGKKELPRVLDGLGIAIMSTSKGVEWLSTSRAAQALGVKFKGKSAGSYGNVSAFSFYADKSLTTGEGGLITTNNKSIYKNLLLLRNQGRIKSGTFVHNNLGYNFRYNDILASIGLSQLKKFDFIKKRKLEIYNLFQKNLNDLSQVKFFKPIKNSNFIPFRIPIIVKNLSKLIIFLEKNKIQTRGFFYPLHEQKGVHIAKKNRKKNNFYSNSIYGNKNGLALPCYPSLKNSEIEFICKKIKKFYLKS